MLYGCALHQRGGPPGLCTRLHGIGRAAQWDFVVSVKRHQYHAQHAGALGFGLTSQVKHLGHGFLHDDLISFGGLGFDIVQATFQCLDQMAGVLKVAAPQQAHAFAGQAVGAVGAGGVVGQHHAFRCSSAAFRTP